MKVIEPSFEILSEISDGGIKELKHIEKIGRICYKSEDRISEDGESAKKFIRNLIKHGHLSVIEHSSISIKFTVDRGVSHELVRHRLASYSQESTRYVNYSIDRFGNEITVVIPTKFKFGKYKCIINTNECYDDKKVIKLDDGVYRNDNPEEFALMADWVAGVSQDIPLHVTRYFPARNYHMPSTDIELIYALRDIAKGRLRHVHIGNV